MSLFTRLKNTFSSRRLESELAEEIQDHLARRAADFEKNGFTSEDSLKLAARQFGNVTLLTERSREVRLSSQLESTLQDIRYGWRGLRKHPVFALTAVTSLALVIAANTAIYSIVDATMLRPVPVPQPQLLFSLSLPDIAEPGRETSGDRESFSYPLYRQLSDAAGNTARLALFGYVEQTDVRCPGTDDVPERVSTQFVSSNSFEALEVPPAIGYLFSAADEGKGGANAVAVLSYEYWQRRFHGSPDIVGRRIEMKAKKFLVTGVAREGFFGIEPGKFVDVWLPANMYSPQALTRAGWNWARIAGRISPDASREELKARLQPHIHQYLSDMVKQFPTMPDSVRAQFLNLEVDVRRATHGVSPFRETFQRPLLIVLGVATVLLLIACSNVASLLLARAAARSAEMGMRISLGAGRLRLIRQLLTESLLLASISGGLGWLLARVAAPSLVAILSDESDPVRLALALDSRVLAFSIAATASAAILFGLAPALQAAGVAALHALHGTRVSLGASKLNRLLVGTQVAFAFSLVIAGAAFVFSLRNLVSVDVGFDRHNVTVLTITSEAGQRARDARLQAMEQFRDQISKQAGIDAVATSGSPVYAGRGWSVQIQIPGQAPSQREEMFQSVSPGYFNVLRTPIVRGRDFEARDMYTTDPVPAVVNEAFARRYFPNMNPVGRTFVRPAETPAVRHLIIGLIRDLRYADLRTPVEPTAYVPISGNDAFTLYVRSSSLSTGSIVKLVQSQIQGPGPQTRIGQISTLENLIGDTIRRERLLAGLGGTLALFGLLLAAMGLFGVLNYSVTRRMKEIGIRSALGATAREVATLVIGDLLTITGSGMAVGLVVALIGIRSFERLLFGISATDVSTISTAALIFVTAALIAGLVPALRATSVDPVAALRQE